MSVEVALGAYILPDAHRVFKYFPGKSYKFYELVQQTNLAIIDVRGLESLGDDPTKWNKDELLDLISSDRIERSIARGARPPSRLVNSVGDKATQTFLEGLFLKARKGDLILMPGRGYTTDVLIGQLLDKAGELSSIKAEDDDGSHTYYGRRVKWIGALEKRYFGGDVINLLHSQAAFFDIGKSHYEDIYRMAFDNFIYDSQYVATFRTSKSIFTPKDSFLTSVWLELLEVLEEAREGGADLPDGTIFDLVIDSDIKEDDRDDLSISVQSPGWFRIRSIVAAPLASLALFAMAAQAVPYDVAINATTSAHIVGQADDTCLGDVDASVRDYIRLLGKDRWEQACRLAKQADAEAKLKADAKVTLPAVKEEN